MSSLPQDAAGYEALSAGFRWRVPERFNIGVEVCDRVFNLDLVHDFRLSPAQAMASSRALHVPMRPPLRWVAPYSIVLPR